MAGSSFFALLDDIASLLDDVAAMTKIATKKTAGVLGDDLALNAQQVSGVHADRELPVVWAVAKGSLVNKAILVPAALLISMLAPWAVLPLLMVGGAYLCYEGVEKLAHRLLHRAAEDAQHHAALLQAVSDPKIDLVAKERDKIRGAIRTDFILSAEIIVIALGTVAGKPFGVQLGVLVGVALVITIAVYGLVAAIVKLDDLGLSLCRSDRPALVRGFGRYLLWIAPKLMKLLSFAGTIAMFLVGGHILVEGIPALHHLDMAWHHTSMGWLRVMTLNLVVGILVGAILVAAVTGIKHWQRR
jgi:predicted DNA repair protein MutK